MGYDGTLKFDTKVDNSGFESGIKKLSTVAKAGAAAVTTAMGAAIGAAIKVGAGFESSMSQVAATMGMTVEQINSGDKSFQVLEQAAKDAGATTQFSASQAGEALNYLALAGYDAEKSIQALPDVLNLAAAGGLDLGYASDLVTDSMSALGLETSELTGFTDQLAKASQKSNTSVGQLGEAILTVGGTAKNLAGGTVELSTELGILADNGVKGAEGGTALRNIILSLSAPTDKAAAAMKSLGVDAFDTDGNMRPLNETLKDFDSKLSTMSQQEKTNVLNTIFNKVDLKSVDALLANCGGRFDELSGYIANADGAAADMAETMNDNLKGQLTILGSSLEGVGIQVYEKFEGPLKQAAKTAIDSVSSIGRSLSSGKLSSSIDSLAKSTGTFMEQAALLAGKELPKVVDAMAFVVENGKTLVITIGSIKTVMVGFTVAKKVKEFAVAWEAARIAARSYAVGMTASLTATQAAVGGMTAQISLSTAAMAAFNAVTGMGVVGGLCVAVGALVAGLAILDATTDNLTEAERELNNELETAQSNLKEQKDSIAELAKTRQENIDASMSEIDYAQRQIESLQSMVDENGRVKTGYEERAKALAEQVNTIIPDAIRLTEDEGASYLKVADNLELLMAKKKVNALLEAHQEEYTQAIKNQKAAVEDMVNAEKLLAKEKENLIAKQEEYRKACETGRDSAIQTAQMELDSAQQQVNSAQKVYDEKTQIAQDTFKEIDYCNNLEVLSHSKKVEEINQGLQDLEYNLKEYTGKNSEELKTQLQDTSAFYTEQTNLAKTSGSEISQAQFDAMVEARDNANAAVAEYTKTGQEIPKNIQQGIVDNEEIFIKQVDAMVKNGSISAEESKKYFSEAGLNAVYGFANALGAKDAIALVVRKAKELGMAALRGTKEALDEHSPSKETYKIGDYYVQGFVNGVKDKTSEAEKAAAEMSKSILQSANDIVSEQKFYNKMSTKQEISFWEEMLNINKVQSDELKTIQKSLYTAREKLEKESFDHSKQWISDRKYYNELSLSEELQAWKRVQERYAEGTSQRIEAEKEVYRVKQEITEKMESLEKEYTDAVAKRSEEIFKSYGLFDEVKEKEEVTGKQLLSNLGNQISSMEDFYANLDQLSAKGVSADLVEEIRKMGVGASGQLKELLKLSDTDLQKYSDMYGEKQRLANEQALKEMEPLRTEMDAKTKELLDGIEGEFDRSPDIGKNMALGLAEGIRNGMSTVISAAISIAQAAMRAARDELGIHSPSKVFAEIGRNTSRGFEVGVTDEMPSVERTMTAEIAQLVRQIQAAVESESSQLSMNLTAESSYLAGRQASVGTTKEINTIVKEKVVAVDCVGNLKDVAKVIRPYLVQENKRIGGTLVKGGV